LKRVRLRSRAKRDVREAYEWYLDRDEEVATRFTAEFERTLEHLERFPSAGSFVPGVPDPEVRRMPIDGFPYHVVFVRTVRWIIVVAVAHDRRRPGYWR
jgi:plasmid stabilization system protein ParE